MGATTKAANFELAVPDSSSPKTSSWQGALVPMDRKPSPVRDSSCLVNQSEDRPYNGESNGKENGKLNGNPRSFKGVYRDITHNNGESNGKENGK